MADFAAAARGKGQMTSLISARFGRKRHGDAFESYRATERIAIICPHYFLRAWMISSGSAADSSRRMA